VERNKENENPLEKKKGGEKANMREKGDQGEE